jgi:hypothetical protein
MSPSWKVIFIASTSWSEITANRCDEFGRPGRSRPEEGDPVQIV